MILDPVLTVECDRCEDIYECSMTPLAGGCWDARNLSDELRRKGWRVDGDTHTCPDCLAKDGR